MGGRKQLERERDAPLGQRRMLSEPEQLLHPQRNCRPAFGSVIDCRRGPGRRAEVGRRLVVEAALEIPRKTRPERIKEVVVGDLVQAGLADEERRQPAGIGGKRLVGKVGPRLAFGPAQEHDPVAPLLQMCAPRQASGP